MATAGRAGRSGRVALDGKTNKRALAKDEVLSPGEVLRVRIWYSTDGGQPRR